MQFKHPELLYALFLLLIPIIVHLFQLRKFQKEAFTNVAFLKNVVIQHRKSSQIKKWLILATRLLLLSFLIIAFAQPFSTNSDTFNLKKETVIYLDNSFSMEAKGNQGPLLKRAIQDIITQVPEDETVSILTHDALFKNTTIKAIKNELLQISYAPHTLSYNAAYLKAKTLFKEASSLKNIIFISDFQQQDAAFQPEPDSLIHIQAVQLKPETVHNISIDSAYISKANATHTELSVIINNSGKDIENLPISLFDNGTLLTKTSVSAKRNTIATFSLPNNTVINGTLTIQDNQLQFDNSLFFNINNPEKTNVLSINEADDDFLKRIYTEDEFNYTATPFLQLNYATLEQQDLIILNEISSIPNSLIAALKTVTDQGGLLLVIPAKNGNLTTYNTLLAPYHIELGKLAESEKHITSIHFSHPLFNQDVFEKQVKNFQYPKVNSYFSSKTKHTSTALSFEDESPFLLENKGLYLLTAALNKENSNFKNSPLIVPTFYNIGKASFKNPRLFYTIGHENVFDVKVKLQQDAIISLVNSNTNLIPRQQYFNNKVTIRTHNEPALAGIYTIKNKDEALQNISYNYNRNENRLLYQELTSLKNMTVNHSIIDTFNTIKSNTKVHALWKWFAIFALAFLFIELLILKYFK
ncbi:BatA domain-containing protein [Mariniflexile ostreae]|uniref:BatA domain-containing protein n=1 Tax=Mariniflexile ostreae TaxID=1520892 RepID=A0ABV5FEW0_9FLAO